MNPKEIAFVCYGVNDLKESRNFYEGVLKLKLGNVWEGEDMGFIEYEMGPHTLAIGKGAPKFKPGKDGATVALEVEDFEIAIAHIRDANIVFEMEPHETGSCFMALICDPSGNQIMIHKRK